MTDKINKEDKEEEVEVAEEHGEEQPEGSKVSLMPGGDYTIHVLIQSCRNLILFEEDVCDPIVYLTMMDQTRQTTSKSNITRDTIVKYDEHLFLEINGHTQEQLQQAIIKIQVMNKGFFRNDLIGEFCIPASTVYNMNDHTLLDQLVGVSNLDDNQGQRTTGTVALSINVKGPNDPAQELKMASESKLNVKPPIMPASIKKVYKQVYIRFLLAESLPNMDESIFSTSTTEAYIQVKYGQTVLKTEIVATSKEGNCKWFEEIQIPLELPLTQDYIQIEVWDYDFPDKDDLIASYRFKVERALRFDTTDTEAVQNEDSGSEQITESKDNKDKDNVHLHMIEWINLYGGPVGYSNAVYNYMNENSDAASHWAGRVLVEYWSHDNKFPRLKKIKLNEKDCRENIEQVMKPRQYFITGQIMSAINLPDKKDYKIKLQLGNKSWTSNEPVQTEANYARWNFSFQESWTDEISMLEKFPYFFVYLLDDDVPICYYRDNIARFTEEENTPLEWLFFKVDQAVDSVKLLHQAGCFSLRMHVRDVTEKGQFNPKVFPNWKRGMPRRNNAYKLRVAIYQCQSLPPADSEGTSDPYVKIWSSDPSTSVETSVNYDTNNPIYYELKQTNIELPPALDDAPPIQLEIYDRDEGVLDSDDYLGRANIFLKDLSQEDLSRGDRIPRPAWYPVKFAASDKWDSKNGARILCSFCLLDFDMKPALPAESIQLDRTFDIGDDTEGNPVPYPMPDLNIQEFQCEINVLGLRSLKPEGILPINKAFVKFKLKSMLKNEQARAVKDITTLPTEKGSNPNIKKTLTFEMRLPSIALYVPRMTCEVFDNLYFAGLPQPQIGSFMLDVGKARSDMLQRDAEVHHNLSNTLKILQAARAQIQQSHERDRPGEVKRFASIVDDVVLQLENEKEIVDLELIKLEAEEELEFRNGDENAERAELANKRFKEQRLVKEMEAYERNYGVRSEDSEEEAKQVKRQENRSKRQITMKNKLLDLTINKNLERKNRLNDQVALQDKTDGYNNLIYPKYIWDERLSVDVEYDQPPESLFLPVSFNKTSRDGKKHFRRYYTEELEKARDLNGRLLVTSPFLAQPIHRTQSKPKSAATGATGWFKGLIGGAAAPEELGGDTLVTVGHLKAKLSVYNKELKMQRQAEIDRLLIQLKAEIEACFNLESINWSKGTSQEKFPTSLWEKLDPSLDVTYSDIKEGIARLQDFVVKAGLGQLRLEQLVGELVGVAYLQKALKTQIKCRTRIYVLNAIRVEKRDLFSESDPYIIARCGQKEVSERDNYKVDTADPVFNQCFEFMDQFPGSPVLEVEIWDYDEFFGDDQIGSTVIDLDDRYFSRSWQAIDDKPVEYRELYHFSSSRSQGTLKCWVEIDEEDSKRFNKPALDILSEPKLLYEARVVIWHTEDLDEMDFEGCSDAYFRSYFDSDQDQSTDTHWRCQTGKASFNWRNKFELNNLDKNKNLTVQAWDRDLIASDDLIGSFQLPLSILFEDVYLTNREFHMSYDYWTSHMKTKLFEDGHGDIMEKIEFDSKDEKEEKFWVPLTRFDKVLKKDKMAGKVLISVYILPKEHADKKPLGSGRENVNNDPYLPEPEGRIEFSMNPFTLLSQLIPEKFRRQILCCIYGLFCLVLLIYMLPMIVSNGISKLIFG